MVDRLTYETELFGTATADDRWPLGEMDQPYSFPPGVKKNTSGTMH